MASTVVLPRRCRHRSRIEMHSVNSQLLNLTGGSGQRHCRRIDIAQPFGWPLQAATHAHAVHDHVPTSDNRTTHYHGTGSPDASSAMEASSTNDGICVRHRVRHRRCERGDGDSSKQQRAHGFPPSFPVRTLPALMNRTERGERQRSTSNAKHDNLILMAA
jgi:hypothetical protein